MAEFSEETLRKIAAQKVTFRYSIKIHAICYILVNVLLVTINIIYTPNYLWVFYPILGWLVGLSIHWVAYLTWSRGINYGKRAIIFHFSIWIFTMPLLVVTNFLTAGTLNWVLYPAISWGFGLIAHIILYYFIISTKPTQIEKTSRKERAIEKEMQKIREKRKKEEGSS